MENGRLITVRNFHFLSTCMRWCLGGYNRCLTMMLYDEKVNIKNTNKRIGQTRIPWTNRRWDQVLSCLCLIYQILI